MMINLTPEQVAELHRRFAEKDEETNEDDGGTDYLVEEHGWKRTFGWNSDGEPPDNQRVMAYSADLWEMTPPGEAPISEYWFDGLRWCYDDADAPEGKGVMYDVNMTCWREFPKTSS